MPYYCGCVVSPIMECVAEILYVFASIFGVGELYPFDYQRSNGWGIRTSSETAVSVCVESTGLMAKFKFSERRFHLRCIV